MSSRSFTVRTHQVIGHVQPPARLASIVGVRGRGRWANPSGDSFSQLWCPLPMLPAWPSPQAALSHLQVAFGGEPGSALSAAQGWQPPRQGNATRPARCDVQSVEAVQELHPARRLIQRTRRHRVDRNRGPCAWNSSTRSNTKARQGFTQRPDLSVIWFSEEHIILG